MHPDLRGTSLTMLLILLSLAGCNCTEKPAVFREDALHILNAPTTDSIFIMVDGARLDAAGSARDANDVPFRASGASSIAMAALGNFVPMGSRVVSTPYGNIEQPGSNELVVFAPGRAPALVENIVWTAGRDIVDVQLRDPVHIRAKVWIPSNWSRGAIEAARVEANRIMNNEGLGCVLDEFEYAATQYRQGQIPVGQIGDTTDAQWRAEFLSSYVRTTGRLNIYILDRVEHSDSRGHCWVHETPDGITDIIVLGRNPGPTLLLHELGHAFGLEHTDDASFVRDIENYDSQNVMHSLSNTRRYFTEGQIFRAHAKSESLLWRSADSTRWVPREIYSRSGGRGDQDLTFQFNLPPLCRRLIVEETRGDCLR